MINKLSWLFLSGWQDSNLRPSGPKPDALPDCATPRTKFSTPLKCAEREGFEPSVHFKGVRRFSKPVLSATQPPLRFPYFRDCKVRNNIFLKQELFYFL